MFKFYCFIYVQNLYAKLLLNQVQKLRTKIYNKKITLKSVIKKKTSKANFLD